MRWIAAVMAGLLAAGGAFANEAINPRFEVVDGANAAMPSKWYRGSEIGEVALDPAVKSDNGSPAVRMRRQGAAGFTGLMQHQDGKRWAGKTVVLRARLRAKDVTAGTLRLWLRGDGAERSGKGFFSSAARIPVDADWFTHKVILDIEEGATNIAYGATLSGAGTAWIAEVDLREADPKVDPPAAVAVAYLDEAIEKIRRYALKADGVDWDKAREKALLYSHGAQTPEQAHDAIVFLVRGLKDNHSLFLSAIESRAGAENRRVDDFDLHSEMVGRHALLRIPGFGMAHADRQVAFADDIAARVQTLAASTPCGWVIDLREDTGGNMYPMLAGLWPFLGDETLGYFVRGETRRPWRVLRMGRLASAEKATLIHAPVAVLTGPRTNSSGEAVALSFRGRPNTRTFGLATSGRSTANAPYPMSDGARLVLMTSVMADRTGWLAGAKIPPDVEVAFAKGPVAASGDPVIRAAARWLDGFKCPGSTPP
jgi:hypothetical protein